MKGSLWNAVLSSASGAVFAPVADGARKIVQQMEFATNTTLQSETEIYQIHQMFRVLDFFPATDSVRQVFFSADAASNVQAVPGVAGTGCTEHTAQCTACTAPGAINPVA